MASNVTAIAAGDWHSLFLKNDGSLWAMGFKVWPVGRRHLQQYTTNLPEQIVASNVTAIAAGDRPQPVSQERRQSVGHGLTTVMASWATALTTTPTGPSRLWPATSRRLPQEMRHSLFLKSDGSLWAMGDNTYGQLGDGTYNNTNQPEQIVASGVTAIAAGGYHSLFLKSDGSLWAMG